MSVFNNPTNQTLKLYLSNLPPGAKLVFDWFVTTGITNDSLTVRKNGLGSAIATLTNGQQNNVTLNVDADTTYLDFVYSRLSTTGGSSQAILSNVVLHLPPGIAPGSLVVTPGVNGVHVAWVSDEPAQGQLLYGSSTNLGQITPLEGGFSTNHSITVSNWTANVPLNFRIVDADALAQVKTNALMRSFSIPELSITNASPSTVRTRWNSDPGQWQLQDAPALSASYNVVTNAVGLSGFTNSVTLPATNPANFFRLERTAAPGHVVIGP